MEGKQTEIFGSSQSERYVTTHIEKNSCTCDWPLIYDLPIDADKIVTVLDAGCGPGIKSIDILQRLKPQKVVGIEPSDKAVELLKSKYSDYPQVEFIPASIDAIPYENDSFDLTICFSVLHWIGRNEYLKALGELIRVTKRYLLIMDFYASQTYKNAYHHLEGLYTYKCDFEPPIIASGIMKPIDRTYYAEENGKIRMLEKSDFNEFLGNSLSYCGRKMVLFEKDYDNIKDFSASDFV